MVCLQITLLCDATKADNDWSFSQNEAKRPRRVHQELLIWREPHRIASSRQLSCCHPEHESGDSYSKLVVMISAVSREDDSHVS
jgi:hypothetical protein